MESKEEILKDLNRISNEIDRSMLIMFIKFIILILVLIAIGIVIGVFTSWILAIIYYVFVFGFFSYNAWKSILDD